MKKQLFFIVSKVSKQHVIFQICIYDFNVSHSGLDGYCPHTISKQHKQKSSRKLEKLDKYFSTYENDLTQIEHLFALFIIEHKFLNSKIAKKFTLTRTKTAILVNFKQNIGCFTTKKYFHLEQIIETMLLIRNFIL